MEVLTTLSEIIASAHTAIVVIDMQNDYATQTGLWQPNVAPI
ncbi:hypothetical protein ACFLVR_04840 [Chloroflexota bacterium]